MATSSMPPRAERAQVTAPSTRAAASPLPLILGCAATIVSLAIAVVVGFAMSAPVVVLGVTVPLVEGGFVWLSVIGYLLTPMAVIGCYGWDVVAQRNGLRANRNFVLRPSSTRALLFLAGIAIVIGAWHVINISVPLSEWLGFA